MEDTRNMSKLTPSEAIMAALGVVEDAEECMIIQVHADGDISWTCTTDAWHKKLGMVEFVKSCILGKITESYLK
jgi:hypothetical protein